MHVFIDTDRTPGGGADFPGLGRPLCGSGTVTSILKEDEGHHSRWYGNT